MIHNDFKHLPCMLCHRPLQLLFLIMPVLVVVSNDASCYLQHQSEPSHVADSVVQGERAHPEREASGRPPEQLARLQPCGPRTNRSFHHELRGRLRAGTAWQDSWLSEGRSETASFVRDEGESVRRIQVCMLTRR